MSVRPPCQPDELDPHDDEWRAPRRRSDGRLTTVDPAERALRDPPPFPATGAYRQAILDDQWAEDELDAVDRELAEVVARRRHLLRRRSEPLRPERWPTPA